VSTVAEAKKPRVVGIAILCVIAGVLNVQRGLEVLSVVSAVVVLDVPVLVRLTTYLTLLLAAFDIVAAVLLMLYKQSGPQLAAFAFFLGLLINVYNIVSTGNTLTQDIGIVVQLIVLYYAYIYMTRDPQRTFFS